MTTPEQILTARKRVGRTQAQMAKLFGVCMHTWHRWETGAYTPPPKHQLKLQAFVRKFGGE